MDELISIIINEVLGGEYPLEAIIHEDESTGWGDVEYPVYLLALSAPQAKKLLELLRGLRG